MMRRRLLLGLVAALGATMLPATAGAQVDPCAVPIQNPIVCENSKPGSPPSEWDAWFHGNDALQGYATSMSVNAGSSISFKVDTTLSDYRIDIYRVGYYAGNGARRIASNVSHGPAVNQPNCLTDSTTGLIDCRNWSVSATWTVPSTAVSGLYFAKLAPLSGSDFSHIPFVVRNDAIASDVVVQTSDATWQAYNTYGGNSLYKCTVACPPGNPAAYKAAYEVSYNRPFHSASDDNGRSWWEYAEYPMIRFLERNGYNVTYISQVDTESRGALLRNHKLFVSSGHDEYWSANQRANVTAARDAGVNLAFFSGNLMFWKTRYKADGAGTANRTLVSYKDTHFDAPADPVEWTGTWRDRRFPAPGADYEPENSLTGLSFLVNLDDSAIRVPDTYKSLRFWRNTAVANLASGQSATLAPKSLGYEWDADADNGFRPPGQFRLSSTTVSVPEAFVDYGATVEAATATHNMVLYRASSGALVFNTGTVQWAFGLDEANPDGNAPNATMRQATVNVFADMGVQPATLISGLTRAVQSTDAAAPTSTITSPADNSSRGDGTAVTVSGTATDIGGVVAGVEVSTDDGRTWHPATGTSNWTYTWVAHGNPSTRIRVRAVDDSGNLETAGSGIVVNVTCGCSVWGNGVTPDTPDSGDPNSAELGFKFKADRYGAITGIRFYKSAANTGTHVGSLWSSNGTKLAQATFTNETASGWQTATFSSPVTIEAGQTYVASYFAPNGHFAATSAYFWRAPSPPPHGLAMTDSGPLHALRNTGTTTNGMYAYASAPQFPDRSYNASNYWVDVVYKPTPPPDQVTNVTATEAGRTSAQVSWSTPTGGAATSYTVTPYIGSQAQATTTITGTPPLTTATISDLANGTTYRFSVRASNPAGSGPESALSNEVTPLNAVPPSAPTGVVARPATTSALVSWTAPGSNGDSTLTGYTITPYEDGVALPGVDVAPSDTTATITGLTNGRSYTFKVRAQNSVGTGPDSEASVAVTPAHTVFEFATPPVVDSLDSTSVELGMKFRPDVDGSVTGVRFYKAAANTGAHTGSLWTAGGTRLAQVTFTDETDTGWQSATFSAPVPVTAGTTYVVSYFAPSGRYSYTPEGLQNGIDNPPLRGVANSTSANGVYAYGFSSRFPTSTYNATAYAVDPLFAVPAPGAVTGVSASAGGPTSAYVSWSAPATGGQAARYRITPYIGTTAQAPTTVSGSPPATVKRVSGLTTGTSYTFTVRAINSSGEGPESSASNAVTPDQPIAPGAPTGVQASPATRSARVSWTAPEDDGESPITGYSVIPYRDGIAGTPVTTDGSTTAITVTGLTNGASYSFRVRATNAIGTSPESAASTTVVPRNTVFDFAAPAVSDSGDGSGVELGMKFRADDSGTITGVRFYKSAANTGSHTGSLWTAGGTLLAQTTFTGETATGWQTALFPTPVPITAGNTYVVSYHAPRGHYAASAGGFSTAIDSPPLHAPASGTTANGLYVYSGSPVFPNGSYNASNYWVDVLFAAAPPPGTVTSVSATAGPAAATVSWTAPSSGGAPTSYVVTPFIGSDAQTTKTVTGSPPATTTTVSDLTPGTAYTFKVRAVNGEGAGPDSAASNSVTPTAASQPDAPTDVTADPDAHSASVTWTAPVADGGSLITGYTVTPYAGGDRQPSVDVPASARRAAVAGLTAGTSYTFTVRAVNAVGSGPESAASAAVVPLSAIFDDATPGVVDSGDGGAVQLGVKFRSSVAGSVRGVRFYKSAANTGTHVGSLWSASGELLAQATFTGETAGGWQKVWFDSPVAIEADTTYVVGYHAPNGRYSVTGAAFAGGGVTNPPLTALADTVSANGVYAYSASPTFPTSTYNAGNYWVDVLFGS